MRPQPIKFTCELPPNISKEEAERITRAFAEGLGAGLRKDPLPETWDYKDLWKKYLRKHPPTEQTVRRHIRLGKIPEPLTKAGKAVGSWRWSPAQLDQFGIR